MFIPRDEQFTGCLVGQCLGDALGCPVEGFPALDCEQHVASTLRAWLAGQDLASFGGQYTDDSQLARELLQSFTECGWFDPAHYATRIAAIFGEDRIVGRGMSTHQAAMKLIAGVSWRESGTPPPTAGNGSAMRAAPIGLIYFEDAPGMLAAAREQSWITHQDPRCLAGSIAIAGATALAIRPLPLDVPLFLRQLAVWVATADGEFGGYLEQLSHWLRWPIEDAARVIGRIGRRPDDDGSWDGIAPYVTGSVLWSLYSFLRSPGDFHETMRTAIRVGGDVDTTAAMAGALSGAHLGLAALPQHLVRRVRDRHTWGYAELIELATRTFHLVVRG